MLKERLPTFQTEITSPEALEGCWETQADDDMPNGDLRRRKIDLVTEFIGTQPLSCVARGTDASRVVFTVGAGLASITAYNGEGFCVVVTHPSMGADRGEMHRCSTLQDVADVMRSISGD